MVAERGSFHRIVHATDFSPASQPAFRWAVELARGRRAELTLVHVLAPPMPVGGEGYVPPRIYQDVLAEARAEAQRLLAALAARARRAGARASTLLLEGVAHEGIVRAVRRRRADLLVLGTHGRTGLARVFLGSVAARVVATAPCPVLTVRGRGGR